MSERRLYLLRRGDVVSLFDSRLGRWREAEVMAANLAVFTAKAGNVWFELPVTPQHVRPVHIAYCRACELRRAA